MTDQELFIEISPKNELVFQHFLDKNFNLFYSIAHKVMFTTASHEDILDCLLESFTYIWFHIHLYVPEKYSFRSWCSLIVISRAQNKYISIKRYAQKQEHIKAYKKTQTSFFSSAEEIYLNQQSYLNITRKIDLLPQPTRDIFIQRYISGIKPQKIAPFFNITPKEVDRHLRKAKKILRRDLKDDEYK